MLSLGQGTQEAYLKREVATERVKAKTSKNDKLNSELILDFPLPARRAWSQQFTFKP